MQNWKIAPLWLAGMFGAALVLGGLAQGQILRFSGGAPIVQGLPPVPNGVTLQAIDGGNTLYNDNGWTYAVNNGWDSPTFYPIGVFLDSVDQTAANRYISTGLNTVFTFFSNQDLSVLRTNQINAIVNSGELYTGAGQTTGTSGILTTGLQTSLGTESVGLLTVDEPAAYTGDNTPGSAGGKNIANPIQGSPQFGGGVVNSTIQNGRFWFTNFTNAWQGQIPGNVIPVGSDGTQNAVLTTEITSPSSGLTPRHVTFHGIDWYWMTSVYGIIGPVTSAAIYGQPCCMAGVDARRGTNYGAMLDGVRRITAISGAVRPIYWVIEAGGPWGPTESTTLYTYIAPQEIDWAAWSTVIHGARALYYFQNSLGGPNIGGTILGNPIGLNVQGITTSASVAGGTMTMAVTGVCPLCTATSSIQPGMQITGPGFTPATVLSQFTGAPGLGGTYLIDPPSTTASQTVTILQVSSITSQVGSTNLLIKNLAPIINANTAQNYVTVNPGGWLYAPFYNYMQINSGIDAIAKYYTGSNITALSGETLGKTYYIFAQTRASEPTTSITATFTLAGSASTVTVIGENRTITVTNGIFSDTFANAWTKHIYRVDNPGLLTTTTKHFYVTTTGSSTVAVPSDWNNSKARSIEVIGGGGGGDDGDSFHAGGSGGGGAAYCKISNPTYTPGENISAFIGTGGMHGAPATAGGNTTFNMTGDAGIALQANGGAGATDGGAPAPGAGGTCIIGTVKNSGGSGGATSNQIAGTGGGGAGGPNGAGGSGGGFSTGGTIVGGTGGGGNGGGSNGQDQPAAASGIAAGIPGRPGGNNSIGSGGGAGGQGNISGTNGMLGGGGGGAASQDGLSTVPGFVGGTGGTGFEWDLTHGSGGGGGGGGGGTDAGEVPSQGGLGGTYGGGGGGGAHSSATNGNGGNGAPGIIVFTYIP